MLINAGISGINAIIGALHSNGISLIILIVLLLVISVLSFNVFSIRHSLFMRSICLIRTSEKIVFLTFDDGPSLPYTPLVLDVLQNKGLKATFFCIGSQAVLYPGLIQRISYEGHSIGNHTFGHSWVNTLKDSKAMEEEIHKTNEVIKGISNEYITLFRPPFGVINPAIASAVKRQKMKSIGWNIRSFDTIIDDPEKLMNRICKRLKPGSIILLHDNRRITTEILGVLVDRIEQNGYKIVPLSTCLNTT